MVALPAAYISVSVFDKCGTRVSKATCIHTLLIQACVCGPNKSSFVSKQICSVCGQVSKVLKHAFKPKNCQQTVDKTCSFSRPPSCRLVCCTDASLHSESIQYHLLCTKESSCLSKLCRFGYCVSDDTMTTVLLCYNKLAGSVHCQTSADADIFPAYNEDVFHVQI